MPYESKERVDALLAEAMSKIEEGVALLKEAAGLLPSSEYADLLSRLSPESREFFVELGVLDNRNIQ